MKKTTCLLSGLILLIATNIYADLAYQPGPYVGGQIGWGRLDEGSGYKDYVGSLTNGKSDLANFTAWRAYGGYSFIPFFSIEAGFSRFPKNSYTADSWNLNVETYAIDIVGKITFPLGTFADALSPFSLYGKGGAAYSNIKLSGSLDKKKETIMPTFGAGIIFNFTDNIALDASWNMIMGRNYVDNKEQVNSGKVPVPTGHMFMLGLSYKITGMF